MKVSVFGLGYVGCVSAASLAGDGHVVIGVDVNQQKVDAVNAGRSPIVEPGLDDLLQQGVAQGRLSATTDTASAIHDIDVSLLCVGTPSRRNGSLDLCYLQRVAEQVGHALREKPGYHVVVVRSTVLPGTTHEMVIPALEQASGKKYGEGFGVSVNPEFLRDGTALKDFRSPSVTLVGHNHAADATGTSACMGPWTLRSSARAYVNCSWADTGRDVLRSPMDIIQNGRGPRERMVLPYAQQAVLWNARKLAKRVGGSKYLGSDDCFLDSAAISAGAMRLARA